MKAKAAKDRTVKGRFPDVRRMLVVPLLAMAIALPACTIATSADEASPQSAPAFPTPSEDAPLGGKGGSVVGVVDRVLPAVVNVVAATDGGQGEGTGFVIRSDGVIVTNWHVVETAQRLTVLTSDAEPERFSARVIGGDPAADLAVLDVDATGLDTVPMGESGKLRLGEQVVALGYALGLEGGPSVTTGIVSSLDRIVTAQDANCEQCAEGQRTYNDIIQTDAAINPGNSGGPLVNLNGEVVGINTAGAGAAAAENIGFAIQIDAAKPTILDAVADPNEPVAYLGVGSVDADSPQVQFEFDPAVDQGALLASIAPGGPAERAGLRLGDVVVAFDGESVDGSATLGQLIGDRAPGDPVDVEVVDADGDRRTVQVTLGTNPVAP